MRINDDAHQYGLVLHICGDMQEYGTCLTVAAILELYTAFRIPQEEEKERS